jgi:hypothetical protein
MLLEAILLAYSVAFLLWAGGIVLGRKSCLAAAIGILVISSVVAIIFGIICVRDASGYTNVCAIALFCFGLGALASNSFAKADCPLKRMQRNAVAILCAFAGIMWLFCNNMYRVPY